MCEGETTCTFRESRGRRVSVSRFVQIVPKLRLNLKATLSKNRRLSIGGTADPKHHGMPLSHRVDPLAVACCIILYITFNSMDVTYCCTTEEKVLRIRH